jgi:uncharacterized SAM-binding protein YcdF (DUF218 family)
MVGPITLVVALVAIVLWTFHGDLLRGLAKKWVVSSPLERADAIVVLGGGLALRPAAAIELYDEGYAALILVARASADRGREAAYVRNILLRGGIPSEAIADFDFTLHSTYGEALGALDYVKSRGAKSLIIPTEIFSTRRVDWIFEKKLAPAGVKIFTKPITPGNYGISDWWRSQAGAKDFSREVAKLLYYRLMY